MEFRVAPPELHDVPLLFGPRALTHLQHLHPRAARHFTEHHGRSGCHQNT